MQPRVFKDQGISKTIAKEIETCKIKHDPSCGRPLKNGAIAAPTTGQLVKHAVHQGLPYVGFGFLDNFVMICAGEYIELSLGTTLGIGTMTAAALGRAPHF